LGVKMLFRDPPSAALKIFVLAAVTSYAGVAATHIDGCFRHAGECLLLSPAVLVYWAPAFVVAWIAFAVIVKLAGRGQRVLPLVTLGEKRESAAMRAKGEVGMSFMIAAFSCLGAQSLATAVATRTSGTVHHAAVAADAFLRGRVGVALVLVVIGALSLWALRSLRRPLDEDWNQIR